MGHHSTSSMTSTGSDGQSVSSVSLLRKSIVSWKKNQQDSRKTRKGRKKTTKENKKSSSESSELSSSSSTTVVKFNKKVRIRKIYRIADISQNELQNYYYCNQEMVQM